MGDEYDLAFPPLLEAYGRRERTRDPRLPLSRQLVDTHQRRPLGIVDPEEFEQLLSHYRELYETNANLRARLARSQKDLSEMREEANRLLDSLHAERKAQEMEVVDLRKKMEALEKENLDLQEKLETLRLQHHTTQQKLANEQKKTWALEDRVSKLEHQYSLKSSDLDRILLGQTAYAFLSKMATKWLGIEKWELPETLDKLYELMEGSSDGLTELKKLDHELEGRLASTLKLLRWLRRDLAHPCADHQTNEAPSVQRLCEVADSQDVPDKQKRDMKRIIEFTFGN